jgi:hypothetical protein
MTASPPAWMYRWAGQNVSSGTSTRRRLAGSRRRLAGPAAAGLLLALIAGCGSTPAPGTPPPAPPAPPLTSSFSSTAGAGWAIVEMGGPAAQQENFWQLFARPTGADPWRQATPAGVADNGGLVVASPGGGSLVTGFRPSQDLTYSPLAASTDNGTSWSPAGPLNAGLANVPDALAAGPGDELIALTGSAAELGQHLGASWARLASASALAATPVGKVCGVTGLTAVAFSGDTPMLGASCDRPGAVGILAHTGGAWRTTAPSGPVLPASLAREDIDVLRLIATGSDVVALLRAGAGPDATLVAAWSGDGGTTWKVSDPLRIAGRQLRSTAVGPGWAVGVVLNGGRGETLAGPQSPSWQALPALPQRASTLVLGPQVDAIAASGSTFTAWRLGPSGGWSEAQTVKITIPYGSSG